MSGDYVRVKAYIFVVGIFIASISLVAYCFNSKVGVVNFVHKIENSEGRESDENKDNCWEDSPNDLDFLRIKDILISKFSRDYCYDDIKH